MVKESIINLKKALSNSLQTVPNLIEVLKRGLDGIQEETEASAAYTTDEKVVGTWIDGSEIYEKVIELTTDTAISYTSFTDTTIDTTAIKNVITAIGIHSDGTSFGTLIADPTRTNHTVLGLSTMRNTATATIKTIVLRYTKITTSRSPENDTKNEEVKEITEEKTV